MKRVRYRGSKRVDGSVLVAAVVLMALSVVGVGSVMVVTANYLRIARRSHHRDCCFYMAEAGLAAAVNKLNAASDATITYNESRTMFTGTHKFKHPDWGFVTQLRVETNGAQVVHSEGRYGGQSIRISANVSLRSGERSIHALYAHAVYSGNSSGSTNYSLLIGGTGSRADFVAGDTYSGGNITLSGDAWLRHPEDLDDLDGDGIRASNEDWNDAYVTQTFTNTPTVSEYNAYEAQIASVMDRVYNNGVYDYGEAYRDTIGNGIYEPGEPFTDLDGDGVRHPGDEFTDLNDNGIRDEGEPFVDHGNGEWNDGEEWVEDSVHRYKNRSNGNRVRLNNRYDRAGGYWKRTWWGGWRWKTPSWASSWPAEDFEDGPDGVYYAGEPFVDGNGVYDEGEEFIDDRNGMYDYGSQATGTITGMPPPGPGQRPAVGGDAQISPPDLYHMFYDTPKTAMAPIGALVRWGHDVKVDAAQYGGAMAITDASNPAHIFLRNPPRSGSSYTWSNGAKIYKRSYNKVYDNQGNPRDDFFLEDPTDPTFNSYVRADAIDGTVYTSPMYVDVRPDHNVKLYYIEGNLYVHSPRVYCMRFRREGTRVTFVVRGNITISDEFYYNADYPAGLQREDFNSTVVQNPSDALCLIALKEPNTTDSGNVYVGDAQYGTGGAIHAMLYAENNFVDNNINTSGQPFISVFGNMSAGNHVDIMRSGSNRTRLDVTLDERIRGGSIIVPGLPHPVSSGERSITLDTQWGMVAGSWYCSYMNRLH